jgi:hypothetical protein
MSFVLIGGGFFSIGGFGLDGCPCATKLKTQKSAKKVRMNDFMV